MCNMTNGNQIRVRLADNADRGSSRDILVPEGTTLDQLMAERKSSDWDTNYYADVNGAPGCGCTTLREGDRIVVVPKKVGGAK